MGSETRLRGYVLGIGTWVYGPHFDRGSHPQLAQRDMPAWGWLTEGIEREGKPASTPMKNGQNSHLHIAVSTLKYLFMKMWPVRP